jgi:hypothetical protein
MQISLREKIMNGLFLAFKPFNCAFGICKNYNIGFRHARRLHEKKYYTISSGRVHVWCVKATGMVAGVNAAVAHATFPRENVFE